jgi:heme oxygenase (mycobilin-producing)
MAVVLINPFEVPASAGERFIAEWRKAADYMRRQPGFVRTRLHRALSPEARFGFINIAEWESPEAFRQAIGKPEFASMAAGSPSNYPALYEVVVTEGEEHG